MDIKYEEYLEAGTKKLMEFLSDSGIDEGEKEAVISSFSHELSEHIGDTGKLQDYESLIYGTSIKYMDSRISKVLGNSNAPYSDNEQAITLCAREKEMLSFFAVKNWAVPELSNSKLDECEEILRKRQDSFSVIAKIKEEDYRIDELMRATQDAFTVKKCDEVLELLNELANDIAECEKRKIMIPKISNKNTSKAIKKVTGIRDMAERRENVYREIYEIDLQINEIDTLSKTSPEQWQEIISLGQKQSVLLSECNKKQYSIPVIRYNIPVDVINKYKHFQAMHELDKILSSDRNALSNGKQYSTFLNNCIQQQNNIDICCKNNWVIPDLIVADPARIAKAVQKEKNKGEKIKKFKKGVALILAGISAVAVLVVFCIYKYREGKVQIPFEASYVVGENLDIIYNELKEAGFENIRKEQDFSGWADSDEVLNVSIDSQDSYSKGTYKKPDVSVVITYSSSDRIYATDILKWWKQSDYQTVINALREAGFTKIDIEKVDTLDKIQDQLISSIELNGRNYSNEHCYLPLNAPITVSYYVWKIGIGNDNTEFMGQDYETVIARLRENGFTNVQIERINTGWAKGNTVVGVTVNNTDDYNGNDSFVPDVKIVVKYSSNDRIDATSILENWSAKDYEVLQAELKNKGFTNVIIKERITDDKSINHLAASVTIGNKLFGAGDCYIQKNSAIIMEYYALKITVGQDASSFVSNTEGEYVNVVSNLRNMGFTNIRLLRKDDLINGWITKEGSIDSISIGGNDSFLEADTFYFDAPIVIVVHTFKNSGCEDITETAN